MNTICRISQFCTRHHKLCCRECGRYDKCAAHRLNTPDRCNLAAKAEKKGEHNDK